MTQADSSTALFTISALAVAALILIALRLLTARSRANLAVSGFLAGVISCPLMLAAHTALGLAMAAVGLACLVPAYLYASEDADDGRGGGGGGGGDGNGPEPVPRAPQPADGPDLWADFERAFWSHVADLEPVRS